MTEAPVDVAGSVGIVTGAGRGIGRAIATTLARAGMKVVVAARSRSEIEAVEAECRATGSEALSVQTDVRNEDDIRRLVRQTVSSFGTVDVLVNNAGIGHFAEVINLDVAEFDAMWQVNLRGVFLACKHVLPLMIRQDGGCIINIGSLAGKNSLKGGAGYAATKWGLRGFSSSLMLEVREHHVRVVTIFPGSVDTGFSSRNKKGTTITQPEDVAQAVLFAAAFPSRSMLSEIDLRPTRP